MNKNDEIIVNNSLNDITEEQEEIMKGLNTFIREQSALCLEKYFNYEEMNSIPCLHGRSVELMVFWALNRDLKIVEDTENMKVHVMWRIKKDEHTPKLKSVRVYKNCLVFKTNEYDYENNEWRERRIKYDMKAFKEVGVRYEKQIEEIKARYLNLC